MIRAILLGAICGLIASLITAILCSLRRRKRRLTAQEVCDRWRSGMEAGAEAYRRGIKRL